MKNKKKMIEILRLIHDLTVELATLNNEDWNPTLEERINDLAVANIQARSILNK